MEYDVFISYSRRDYVDENQQIIPGNIVSQIKELFDANGISYWFDEDGVLSGDAFAPIIARNIKSAKIFLFISSVNSNASEWTSNEIATAHEYKKKIIPFRFDDSIYNDSVILYIARLDYIEYKANQTKALTRLLSSIKDYLKGLKEASEQKQLEEERIRNLENAKQEKDARIQLLKNELSSLENRKAEVVKQTIVQEKLLQSLKGEQNIIDTKIKEIKQEIYGSTTIGNTNKSPKTLRTIDIVIICGCAIFGLFGLIFAFILRGINSAYRARTKNNLIEPEIIKLATQCSLITLILLTIIPLLVSMFA